MNPSPLLRPAAVFTLCLTAMPQVGATQALPVRSDSAGVEIVLNASIADAPIRYQVVPRPLVDIGGLSDHLDRELMETAIVSINRLQQGELVVPNGHTLQVYDGAGRWLRSHGRQGEGPREFRQVIYEICPGSERQFAAIEAGPARMAIFSDPETFTGSVRYNGRVTEHGCLRDGTLLVQLERQVGKPGDLAHYVVMDFSGRVLREFGSFPAFGYNRFFERRAHVVGGRGRVVVGDGSSHEFLQHDPSGRLVRVVRTGDIPRAFTAADLRALIRRRIPDGTPASVIDQAMNQVNGLERPERWPAYTRLQVDPANRTWLSEPVTMTGAPAAWAVFDSTGTLLGRVLVDSLQVPGSASRPMILQWGVQEVAVRYFDADGAIHVALLPLRDG